MKRRAVLPDQKIRQHRFLVCRFDFAACRSDNVFFYKDRKISWPDGRIPRFFTPAVDQIDSETDQDQGNECLCTETSLFF